MSFHPAIWHEHRIESRPWTAVDDMRLRAMEKLGIHPMRAARALHRTINATMIRRHRLGLKRRN